MSSKEKVSSTNLNKREGFGSSFGLLAAAIGSAVGLGNIWRFPYITGKYGGAAFLLVYLLSVAAVGIPVMLSEVIIGREGKKDAIGSFKELAPETKWYSSGVLGVLAAFMILSFYSVIAGWTLEYLVNSITNQFAGKDVAAIEAMFTDFISHPIRPVIWQIVFMGITALIVAIGVEEGIEKFSKILIPLLLVIVIILDIRAVTLPGGKEGLSFLFKPDFSELNTEGVLAALGHSFFSLSLGMGIMITYGSYIGKKENLGKAVLKISLADTIIALLAGIAIFPVVFAFGIAPDSGPGLIFITLPNVFPEIPGGYFFAILFFALIAVAALTSTISLLEVVVAYGIEKFSISRKKSTITSFILITILGIFASLSNGPLSEISFFGRNLFDFLDYLTANYFLTISALIASIFLGWRLDKKLVENQLTNDGTISAGYLGLFRFLIRYITPILIVIVFISGVFL